MTSQSTELLPLCECGCGERVKTPGAKFKRGHFRRVHGDGPHVAPVPGPEDEIPDEDLLDLGEPPTDFVQRPGESIDDVFRRAEHETGQPIDWTYVGPGPEPGRDEIPPDEPPADLPPPKGSRRRGAPRVTAGIRKDINAKISLGLEIPGRIWAVRDPWCGTAFVHQRPAIAEALTDIVCDSADLVEWFTGPAGGFMKYLTLAAALQPVAVTIYGHHVAHTIGIGTEAEQKPQDMSRYAA